MRNLLLLCLLAYSATTSLAMSGPFRRLLQVNPPPLPLKLGAPTHIVILKEGRLNPVADINRLIGLPGVTGVVNRYESPILYGFSCKLTTLALLLLSGDVAVDTVSLNMAMTLHQGLAENRIGLMTGPMTINMERIGATDGTSVFKAAAFGIAVLDTGIDTSHTDLNVIDAKNCVDPEASATDDNGHGTHVAGIIGAKNDGVGTFGVVPGSALVSVKVVDSTGYVDFANAICGIDWIGKWPSYFIKTVSMSFGGPGADDGNCGLTNQDALHQAICKATSKQGLVFVASAGNSAVSMASNVPAAYSEVLAVTGMVDTDGEPGTHGPLPSCYLGEIDDRCAATVSNYALSAADKAHVLSAPSLCITSTAMGGGYVSMSGTSMASPHVVGAVAACWGSYNGGLSWTHGPCWGQNSTWIRNRVMADAKAFHDNDHSQGFLGDPNHPIALQPLGAYYGYLVYLGGY